MMLWLAFLPMAAALDEECLLQSQAVTKDSAAASLDLPDCTDLKVNCYDGRGAHSYGMEDWKSKGYKTSDNGCAHDCYHNSGCGGYVYFFAQGMCFQRTYISPDPIGECEVGEIGTESWTFTTNIKKKSTPRGIKGSEEDCANHCNMADAACSAFVHMSAHGGLCFLRRWVSSDPVGECEKGQIGTESWLFTTYVS